MRQPIPLEPYGRVAESDPGLDRDGADEVTLPRAHASCAGVVFEGRYRIHEPLGLGAMGKVYRAEHIELQRTVAIKLIRNRLRGDEQARRRFELEALTMSRLSHPGIVQVQDFGQRASGEPYLVMRLCEGEPLRDVMANAGPLRLERVRHITLQVLDALACAHGEGVVHRDLKPSNVIIGPRDHVTLIDFGIAKSFGPEADELTRVGTFVGSPRYCSPEQLAPERKVGRRSDLYGVGILMYEMLTGHRMYDATTPLAWAVSHISSAPKPILRDDMAPDGPLARFVMMCLAKDPAKRPPSARAAGKLLASLDLSPPAPRPETEPEPEPVEAGTAAAATNEADPDGARGRLPVLLGWFRRALRSRRQPR